MGGYGSGRPSEKIMVEDCMRLDLDFFTRNKLIKEGSSWGGVLYWNRDEENEKSISVEVDVTNIFHAAMTLDYTIRDWWTKEKVHQRYMIDLDYTSPHFGGKRWWALCPVSRCGWVCGRRVSKLYLPPGGRRFGCRTCYGLVYESSRESHKYDRLFSLIGADMGLSGVDVKRILDKGF